MSFQFRPAVRSNTIPLIGLYALSGRGKTYSSLLLARGLVGPEGKIALIDTERGRASLYANQIPGGYDTALLEPPYSPSRYVEALRAAEQSHDIAIIDSGSHEWEGEGGVLSMAESNGSKGLSKWKAPKDQHRKFVDALIGSRVPVIINMRAKHKSRQVKDEYGKPAVVKDDFTSPIQDADFIFEMTVHGEIMEDHSLRVTKHSEPSLVACFEDGKPITIETGEKLAAWCRGETDCRPANDVLTDARAAAENGTASLKAWWRSAPASDRKIAETVGTDLRKTATMADQDGADGETGNNQGAETAFE